MLPWLYFSEREACGWVETDGLGLAFRRTPTGVDASGRSGAFFVHALIWQPGTLSPNVLARLWDAGVWRREPPETLDGPLKAIERLEELELPFAAEPDFELVVRALAQVLDAVSHSVQHVLGLPASLAVPVAAAVAGAIPPKFGLLSFSSFEEPARAGPYELVGELLAEPMSDASVPNEPVAERWTRAARLLLAGRGDTAAGVVEALTERATDRRQFARALGAWADIEGTYLAADVLDEASMKFVSLDQRFVARLAAEGGARGLARAVARVPVGDPFFSAAREARVLNDVLGAVGLEFGRLAPAEALGVVRRIDGLQADTGAMAATLAASWLGGPLKDLSSADALYLATLLVKAPQSAATIAAVAEITDNPPATDSLVGSSLPVDWRAGAAARHPDAVSPETLVFALQGDARFARLYVTESAASGLAALRRAIADAPHGQAVRAAEYAAPHLHTEQRLDLLWLVAPRLEARKRLQLLERWVSRDITDSDAWLRAVVDALVEAVLASRATPGALPSLSRGLFDIDVTWASARHEAWLRLARQLDRGSSLAPASVERAARMIAAMTDETDRDAAAEILVDVCADQVTMGWDGWFQAVGSAQARLGEPSEAFAQRLGRAATRRGQGSRSQIALWTIRWVAVALDSKRISSSVSSKPPLAGLHEVLSDWHVERVREYAAEKSFQRTGRRWLESMAKAAHDLRKGAS